MQNCTKSIYEAPDVHVVTLECQQILAASSGELPGLTEEDINWD